jgi:ABC-2 type transport system ATP-binding protein
MIKIKKMEFNYKKTKLFKNLNLTLKEGNIYGLLGKNGAGKTTLLKLLSGLRYPQKGELSVLDFIPHERDPIFLENIYFIPEDLYVPNISMKMYENLYSSFYPNFDKKIYKKILKEFEIKDDKKLGEFSFGMKKKFLLAFGLAANTKILILDEPTNGLDIPSKSQFRKILARSINDERITIISTHQVRDMEKLIDPIIILDEGKIIFQSSIEDITKKLSFKTVPKISDPDDVLFESKGFGGYLVVTENKDGVETDFDMEVLFNAVTNNTEKVQKIFSKGGK